MNKPRITAAVSGYAQAAEDGALFAPSAARNTGPICEVLRRHAPASGNALELASGTGQHIVEFAAHMPQLHWHPSELDATRRVSVDTYATKSALPNIAPAVAVNATQAGWAAQHPDRALITVNNLLHLISEPEAQTLIRETGRALAIGGIFQLYGPFLRDGEATSEGDAAFDAKLRAEDAEVGYKDDWDVIDWIHASNMELVEVIEMPANNLSFVAKRIF